MWVLKNKIKQNIMNIIVSKKHMKGDIVIYSCETIYGKNNMLIRENSCMQFGMLF